MPVSNAEVEAAKDAIRSMLAETPRPTQERISAATGLTQGYVAKINRCDFVALNSGVRKVVEYSLMSPTKRAEAEVAASGLSDRIAAVASKLAIRNPELGEVVADFIERVAALKRSD